MLLTPEHIPLFFKLCTVLRFAMFAFNLILLTLETKVLGLTINDNGKLVKVNTKILSNTLPLLSSPQSKHLQSTAPILCDSFQK